MRKLLAVIILLGSFASFAVSERFESVNGRPQYSLGEDHFMFYWALWRSFSAEETAQVAANQASLLSRRQSSWKSFECGTDRELKSDGEDFYFFDKLEVDADGQVQSLREANRPGFRYFVVSSINSLQLRRPEVFVAPKRLEGERHADFNERSDQAYAAWQAAGAPQGTYGYAEVVATYRFYAQAFDAAGFISLKDYSKLSAEEFAEITRFAPDRWPFYYDERGHKPHSLKAPSLWAESAQSEDTFRMRLNWNWCDATKPPRVVASFPEGGLPAAGPTRAGRGEEGQSELPLAQGDWQSPKLYTNPQ